ARTISTNTTGPVILAPTDNPLSITATGAVTSTGAGQDGIDGPAGTIWTITNSGAVSSADNYGISLAASGILTNTGRISGVGAVAFHGGGSVTNRAGGSISASGGIGSGFGTGAGIYITGGLGTVTNQGVINGGAYGAALAAGGTVTNTS